MSKLRNKERGRGTILWKLWSTSSDRCASGDTGAGSVEEEPEVTPVQENVSAEPEETPVQESVPVQPQQVLVSSLYSRHSLQVRFLVSSLPIKDCQIS